MHQTLTSTKLFVLAFPTIVSMAQGYYPEVSSVFIGIEPQFNFSSINDTSKVFLNSRHQIISDEVYKTSFYASRYLHTKNTSHRLCFWAENAKQGPYLSAISPFLGYSFSVRLSPRAWLGSSLAFGAVNWSARLPNQTFDLVLPDLNWGISLVKPKTVVGFSAQQALNASKDGLWLRRFWIANFSKRFELSPEFELRMAVLSRFFKDYANDHKVLTSLVWNKTLCFGLGYTAYGTLTFFASPNLNLKSNSLTILAAYSHQTGSRFLPTTNRLELGLGIRFIQQNFMEVDETND